MTHHLLHWEHLLKKTGHRVTRQRVIILDAVCAAGGHTSFDDIYGRTRDRDRSVDRSTVYRALHLFVEVGLVVEAKTGGETLYEIRKVLPHHHLACRACGMEREVSDASVRAMADEVFQNHRFRVATDHLMLFGLCERCQGGERRQGREGNNRGVAR